MPLEGLPLIVEPNYPNAEKFMELYRKPDQSDPNVTIRNCFWSMRLRGDVYIFDEGDKVKVAVLRHFHALSHLINTLGASDAWGIEQEARAVQLLGTLVNHRKFKQYMLTGMFLERSKRSGVTYLFRRLKPTIAIDARNEAEGKSARILCALCMHPIAYYAESWAGAMCPTDDVIAHLMLMRADEHMYWRRCNQHAPDRPQAGI